LKEIAYQIYKTPR